MHLVKSDLNSILSLATSLSISDPSDQQSTWINDKVYHSLNGIYFTVIHNNQIIGFTLFIPLAPTQFAFWLSLIPEFRFKHYGANATQLALNYIFTKANSVLSDVYNNNSHSLKIHNSIMNKFSHSINKTTFIMDKKKFEHNLLKFKRFNSYID